jgi:ubiquitin-conjugating enzyme E2 variant
MSDWNGTILGPPHVSATLSMRITYDVNLLLQSVHENRIYSLKIHCGSQYPDVPPEISFVSKVNLPCVNQQSGKVHDMNAAHEISANTLLKIDPTKVPCLQQWKRDFTMETILIELRR